MSEREAEDKALASFGQTPLDTEAVVAPLWPMQERAFRAGFRAGREQPRYGQLKAEFDRGVQFGLNMAGARPGIPTNVMTTSAPADSELGIELSKIRDRLNALESPRALSAQDRHFADQIDGLLGRVKTLESVDLAKAFEAHSNFSRRLSALEAKLRMMEPIGA